ncbi:zinc finger MYM-type protein 1-like [Sphaerodactylus townsendi]|uniref:zinc finger MYM-type protein 1-like n=1 Tax=Sphaerodactylus townsendi TaxID=933632 RepID=UPI00202703DA|nr:zinc finger MYM-type protein 1-like [Sphaerodactylus townsendi]
MAQYNWLVYTDYLQGALCKVCVLFGGSGFGGPGQQQLGALVKKPFTDWKHATETFEKHEKAEYHQFAVEKAEGFFSVMSGKNQNVIEAISTEDQNIAPENRKKLTALVETVILCGHQEIALRGDCEGGPLGLTEPLHNDGNFRALLQYRARFGDEALKSHLQTQTSDSRFMYTSPSIENEIVELCGNSVQESVIRRIKNKGPGYFSVLADETQDSSRQQQLSLCVHYLDSSCKKSIVREDFIEFILVEDLSASALATTIMERLTSHGLDLEMMVGQGYDGAAVMSGHLKGVRALISEQYPKAHFIHCAAHGLNFVLAHSSEVAMIRNCIGMVKNIINFFRQSSLGNTVLKRTVGENVHSQLVSLCETGPTEKHKAVSRFVEIFNAIVEALYTLGNDGRDSQAFQFIHSLENCQFVISLLILNKVFSYTSSFNVALQTVSINLNEVYTHAKTIIEALEAIRSDASDAVFYSIIEKAKNLLGTTEIKAPLLVSKQTCESNVPASTPEQYYKINIFYPFLDHVIEELKARFASHANIVGNLQILVPGFFIDDGACHLQ